MSFLTPLYLLGALAVSLPVLLHLIRRTPRGRRIFSSVMFVEPTPPQITRRSRIEHWLLLLLRAAAVCLLALIFSRPFLRSEESRSVAAASEQKVLLLDTSASMRRSGLWEEAIRRSKRLLQTGGATTEWAIVAFDSKPTLISDFEDWQELPRSLRAETMISRLGDLEPGWESTELGAALMFATETLTDSAAATTAAGATVTQQIVVVSDLQEGAHLERMAGFDWPQHVTLQLERLKPPAEQDNKPDNAGLHVMGPQRPVQRLRISNADEAVGGELTLSWSSGQTDAEPSAESAAVFVPPGESRIVPIPQRPHPAANQLLLTGDLQPFDNTVYIAPEPDDVASVAFLADDRLDDPDGLLYFWQAGLAPTSEQQVETLPLSSDDEVSPDALKTDLVVVARSLSAGEADAVSDFLTGGGTVLVVLRSSAGAATVRVLAGDEGLTAEEAEPTEYAMWTQIDFAHPLFEVFDDPRFSDFSKLRFYAFRRLGGLDESWDISARFDDGSPAVLDRPVGGGRLIVMAAGWERDESTLAVSTKFVPLLWRLLAMALGRENVETQFEVGDRITPVPVGLPEAPFGVESLSGDQGPMSGLSQWMPDAPGLYRLTAGGDSDDPSSLVVAVNLPAEESQTKALDADRFQALGPPLATGTQAAFGPSSALRERQLKNRELEDRQQMWRWLLATVIGLLIAETLLAARTARRLGDQVVSAEGSQ